MLRNPIHTRNEHESPSAGGRSELTVSDRAGIAALVVVLLVVAALRSRHHMFWSDEIMGWFTLRQPDFRSLLHVWRAGLDSSGLWFYVFGRPWLAVFGPSELALRMFSATGIAASAAVIWIALRRIYPLVPVASSVTFIYAVVGTLRWQLANGRTYGVMMLASALVLYLLLRGEESDKPRPLFLLATFAAYALLAGSHILALLYVATFVGIQLALDLRSRRFRPLLYCSALASLSVVAFSRANIQATSALGKPVFWTVKPPLRQLVTTGVLFNKPTMAIAGVLLCLVLFLRPRPRKQRIPVYIILLGFVVLDLFFFTLSYVTTSVYVNRYLLPFIFAGILVFCELFTQLREAEAPYPRLRLIVPAILLPLAAALFFVPRLQRQWLPFRDYTGHLLDALPPGVPVVVTDAGVFVETEFYREHTLRNPLIFADDFAIAADPANSGGVSGTTEMENFKRLGMYPANIVPTATILHDDPDFIVITRGESLWLQRRVLANPDFFAVQSAKFNDDGIDLNIWRVHRR